MVEVKNVTIDGNENYLLLGDALDDANLFCFDDDADFDAAAAMCDELNELDDGGKSLEVMTGEINGDFRFYAVIFAEVNSSACRMYSFSDEQACDTAFQMAMRRFELMDSDDDE